MPTNCSPWAEPGSLSRRCIGLLVAAGVALAAGGAQARGRGSLLAAQEVAAHAAERVAPERLPLVLEKAGVWPRHEDATSIPAPWVFPRVAKCDPAANLRGWPPGRDAPPFPFHEGQTFGMAQLEALRDYLPPFIWEHREKFFFQGMQLVIGRCFNDYSPPGFYRAATAAHAGEPKLTSSGGLVDYRAGLPFPPDRIEPTDPEAGLKWAWNFELRYQGAGFWGDFRTSDMVGRGGRAEPFVGEIFRALTAFRSERRRKGYKAPGAPGKHWVAGGVMREPFDARHYSWRQYRALENMTEAGRTDDLHAYLPNFRRVRRLPGSGVEGIYMPSFSVGVVKPMVVAGLGGGIGGSGGGAAGVGGAVAGSITTKRSGFEGIEMRPLLYSIRVLGVQDILTPINASTPAFPVDPQRDFGPWGLSFANDRWDLRRAVVLQGRAKEERGGDRVVRFVQYVDLQTLAPLYYASWDHRDELIDVGMHVGRWSEEREGYPAWPDAPERPIRVIDTVGAAFANISVEGGWRRESWEIISTPPPDQEFKRLLSVGNLTRRR
ncbi:MAG: DUF1329 domain-containing protein [Deltaproteobacteria bacterium]|nr:DUF1329 domain-containing protein [Deltaproteobacteria bacterium]MBW2359518.1 DUF1329 domain-containing protein [Deltaproteobacteria bacterium]